jgi:hypothetical protein
MRRRFFNAASLVSLVSCIVVAALWTRSYWQTDTIWTALPGDSGIYAWSHPGAFSLVISRPSPWGRVERRGWEASW